MTWSKLLIAYCSQSSKLEGISSSQHLATLSLAILSVRTTRTSQQVIARRKLLEFEAGHLHRGYKAKNSIMITWQISFDYIRAMRPPAVELVRPERYPGLSSPDFSWTDRQSSTLQDIAQDSQEDPSVVSNDEGEAGSSDSDEYEAFEDDI